MATLDWVKVGRYGPRRDLFKNNDDTFTLLVTPPDWIKAGPFKFIFTQDQAIRYQKWGTKIALIQDALPELTQVERDIILTGTTQREETTNNNTVANSAQPLEMKMSNDELFEKLKTALDAYLEDDSVDKETKKERLEEIQSKVDSNISDLEDEIEQDQQAEAGEAEEGGEGKETV